MSRRHSWGDIAAVAFAVLVFGVLVWFLLLGYSGGY